VKKVAEMSASNVVQLKPSVIKFLAVKKRPEQLVRKPNAELRTREYLTETEVDALIAAAKTNRWGHRDALMILLAYRHGLRASELVGLRKEQIDFTGSRIHVRRVKNSDDSTHPLTGKELRALRQQIRDNPNAPYVFVSERGTPFNPISFTQIVEKAGKKAGLNIKCHAHMLRHACGFHLANSGQDTRSIQAYLGHRNIQNTAVYMQLAANRFNGFFRD
jgi:integrase